MKQPETGAWVDYDDAKTKAEAATSLLLPLLDNPEGKTSYQSTVDRINQRIAEIQAELASAGSLITAKTQQL